MSAPLMGLVALIYVFVAVDLWSQGKHGLASAFFFYACANFGFIWAILKE